MKKVFLSLATIFIIQYAFSQEVEQEFVPYYFQDDTVQKFERIGAKIEARSIGYGGYGGINNYLTVFDSKYSDVRFDSYDIPKFIIKLDDYTDALELVVISKADQVKKKKTYRRFIQGGRAYGGGNKDLSKYILVPTLKKIKGNLYEIILEEELEPGEYAFQPIFKGRQAGNILSTSGKTRIYCFGVD